MKKQTIFYTLSSIILICSILCYPTLPSSIPSHWNAQGEIDGWMGSWFIFFPLILMILCYGLFEMLKRIDPKKDNYQRFLKSYEQVQIVIFLFLFCLWFVTLWACYQPSMVDMRLITGLLIGCLFIFFGNSMPKIKSNYTLGIRTPWTLSNDTVWYRTHRLAGKLWFYGGFVCILCLWLPSPLYLFCIVVCIVLLALIPCIYSYLIYKKQRG